MDFESLPRRKVIFGIVYIRDAFGCYVPEISPNSTKVKIRIRVPADCLPLLADLRNRNQEIFVVLTIDAGHQVIKRHDITVGLVNQSQIHPREVFHAAIEDLAVALVIAHNHPSGNLQPSTDDLLATRKLVESSKIVGIPIFDHLIVSESGFVSLRETYPDYFQ